MARWQPDARNRLAAAALDLYEERGFEGTTVAEIAERAGLTKRTFFRHFADKREVLFSGTDELERLIVDGIAAAPATEAPLDAVVAGLAATAEVFDAERLPYARRRAAIVDANPDLRERELIKMERLSTSIAAALGERGVAEPAASLAARAGVTIFHVAFGQWVGGEEQRDFGALIERTARELRAVALA
ncbi:MAG TPA: TetR family transcriptional regulator [Baekduia sp.]|uniref:TetR/AcrR family transcriptional regulator n=1 Tax=Baekduia sp. TaxID=2600305 RepID=UPI002D77B6EF|nr:TetR family transcriptional regulator [Baekduia sp.]HET6510321.1 TetR family transcriptional regulator [Baekduia sp.]